MNPLFVFLVQLWIINAKLLEVGIVFQRIVIELLQERTILLHDLFVEMCCGTGVVVNKRYIFSLLRLYFLVILPCIGDDRGVGEHIDEGSREHLRSRNDSLMRNRSGHGHCVRPVVPRCSRNI